MEKLESNPSIAAINQRVKMLKPAAGKIERDSEAECDRKRASTVR
jgi:hypothetical protein